MNVAVVGAGPAGLYCSYLLRRRLPSARIRVYEQNTANATFGFGVVFSDRALDFLRDEDPSTYNLIAQKTISWPDITLDLKGDVVRIDGIGFSAISRLELLRLLRGRAETVDVKIEYRHRINSIVDLREADLVIGADGANSVVREYSSSEFGTSIDCLTNKFVWYGTTKTFDTLTQSFRVSDHGAFNAHHYRYSPNMSTFIVETNADTWNRTGFTSMGTVEIKTYCEGVFADVLEGHPLISNNSVWRNFPIVSNARWRAGASVLIGDALHTAHFSIGSGTRLAMEDAIALVNALTRQPADLAGALAAYEASRRRLLEKLVAGANASAQWYENFAEHMRLAPLDFAMSYIRRSGRIDRERLRALSPKFMAQYEAHDGKSPAKDQ